MNSVSHINDPSDMSVTLFFWGLIGGSFAVYIFYMRNCHIMNICATVAQ